MGLELTIQSLSRIGWPGSRGRDRADPESAGGRRRAFNPAAAGTPEEALTYIKQLYKAGRTGELAQLLREHQVFREAWQILQQVSAAGCETASALPATPGFMDRLPSPGRDPAAPGITATPRFSPEIHPVQNLHLPASGTAGLLAAALRVYETQSGYWGRERADSPRISLRV